MKTYKLTAFAILLAVAGCSSSGSGSPGGSGGSVGSGGTTGSGGTSGGSGGSPGSGGTPTNQDGGEQDVGTVPDTSGGDGAVADVSAPDVGSGLHGGTSGKYICPAGGNYAGMTPMLSGTPTTINRFANSNGEGPVWVSALSTFLYTSKIMGDDNTRQIWKVDLAGRSEMTIKTGIGNNGMTLDNDDKLVTADHKMSAIVRLDPATGNVIDVIADRYNNNYFQSPNDVIVRGDGNIYFSDPAYFSSQGKRPKTAGTAFYRISPAKVVSVVEDDGATNEPNGVVLSADDNTLYTVVTNTKQVKKWALNADGSISGAGTNFVRPQGNLPDGMCMDCAGNLYVATQSGIEVYSPAGTMLTTLGTAAINCSFGGADHKTLFVTTNGGVYFATTNIPGLP